MLEHESQNPVSGTFLSRNVFMKNVLTRSQMPSILLEFEHSLSSERWLVQWDIHFDRSISTCQVHCPKVDQFVSLTAPFNNRGHRDWLR